MVYGFGQHGASPAFVAACDEFVFLDGASGVTGSHTPSTPKVSGGGLEVLMRQGLSSATPPGR